MRMNTSKKNDTSKAVVVLSGGQDSAICLALAVRKFGPGNVYAITFKYSQRHQVEVKFAKRLAEYFGIAGHKILKLDFFKDLTASALMTPDKAIAKKPGASCPSSVVEGRNAVFLMAASIWAKTLGAKRVYTGVSQADFSGYPDCREVFIKAQEKAIRLALEWPVKIETPFMHKTKADEWALCKKLGILELVKNETVTCYNGIPGKGCGECPACILRNRGLAEFEKAELTASRPRARARKPSC